MCERPLRGSQGEIAPGVAHRGPVRQSKPLDGSKMTNRPAKTAATETGEAWEITYPPDGRATFSDGPKCDSVRRT